MLPALKMMKPPSSSIPFDHWLSWLEKKAKKSIMVDVDDEDGGWNSVQPKRSSNLSMPLGRRFMGRVYSVAGDEAYKPYDPNWNGRSSKLYPMLWKSLAYSILAGESYHRQESVVFFGENVPIRSSMCFKFLTRLCKEAASVDMEEMWTVRLQLDCKQYLKMVLEAEPEFPSVLEVDAFGVLVNFSYLMRLTLDQDERYHHHNLRMIFTLHLFQLLVTMTLDELSGLGKVEEILGGDLDGATASSDGEESIKKLMCEIWANSRNQALPENVEVEKLWIEIGKRA